MSLLDKIRKARETGVEAGGRNFTIRRPTDEEFGALKEEGFGNREAMMHMVKTFTIGWELVELDLIPGGNPVAVPFDSALFAEWVSDQPEVWTPLASKILEAYTAHVKKREENVKN